MKAQSRIGNLNAAERGNVARLKRVRSPGGNHLAVPDRRSRQAGFLHAKAWWKVFRSLGSYLLLVDYTRRLFREGNTASSAELSGILARPGNSTPKAGSRGWRNRGVAACWAASSPPVESGYGRSPQGQRPLSRFAPAKRRAPAKVDTGVHHLANLADARHDSACGVMPIRFPARRRKGRRGAAGLAFHYNRFD